MNITFANLHKNVTYYNTLYKNIFAINKIYY